MEAKAGTLGAVALRRWRRDARLTRPAASAKLGISDRMLAYYESGVRAVPRAILLAVKALAAGLDVAEPEPMTRERWVTVVRDVMDYGTGVPVVGRMLRERDRRRLEDFLTFIRRGPDPALALTDPALFMSPRSATTRAQVSGIAQYRMRAAMEPDRAEKPGGRT